MSDRVEDCLNSKSGELGVVMASSIGESTNRSSDHEDADLDGWWVMHYRSIWWEGGFGFKWVDGVEKRDVGFGWFWLYLPMTSSFPWEFIWLGYSVWVLSSQWWGIQRWLHGWV